MLALLHFIHQRVVKLLLPAVSFGAESLQRAALMIVADEVLFLPVLALLKRVVVK